MSRSLFQRRTVLSGLGTGAIGILLPGAGRTQDSDRQVEGGIGGTGIVGILTDFGSVIVAGYRVATPSGVQVTDAFGARSFASLSRGDSLTVEASGPTSALEAQRIHVTHPLVGTVTDVTDGGQRLTVFGVTVRFETAVRRVKVGDRVAISGLWNGSEVAASSVTSARAELDLVAGTVTRRGGRAFVGPVAVSGRGLTALRSDGYAEIVGKFDPQSQRMVAQSVQTARFTGAAGPLRQLAIEGYLEATSGAPGYRVSGLGHSFERDLQLAPFAQNRVLFRGAYTGLFDAQSALVLPTDPSARRRVLGRLSRSDG